MPRISFGVTDEQWAVLQRCAKQEMRSLSSMAATAVVKQVRRLHYKSTDLLPVTEEEMLLLMDLEKPVQVPAGTCQGKSEAVDGGGEKSCEAKTALGPDDAPAQGSEQESEE